MASNRADRDANGVGDGESVGAAWARRKIGNTLKELRERARITQESAAEHIERHYTTMHKIENGLSGVRLRPKADIEGLGALYGADVETVETLKALVEATRVKGPFTRFKDVIAPEFDLYLGLEGEASEMTSYDIDMVPGLLQTEAYARLINSLPGRDGRPRTDAEITKRVRLRMERQSVLTRKSDPLRVSVILSETVLRRPVGDAGLMAEQLHRIIGVGELPNVTVRVALFDAGLHMGFITGQFIVLRFPGEEPSIAYADGFLGHNNFKDPQEIARYDEAFADISKHALGTGRSRAFIKQIAKELST